jgi:hypothetical protein
MVALSTALPRKRAPRGDVSNPMPSALLDATTEPSIVRVPERSVLAFDGRGAPESPSFQRAIDTLYAVAYALKFTRKLAGADDFKIAPLEARWWTDDPPRGVVDAPRESWRWQLRIAVPSDVRAREIADAIEQVSARVDTRHGGRFETIAEAHAVKLETLNTATLARALRVGANATERASFERLIAKLVELYASWSGAHLEVYLSDPRRTAPQRRRAILLVEPAMRGASPLRA